jgi:hypothetical protein
MSPRIAVLLAIGLAALAGVVYLYVEVSATTPPPVLAEGPTRPPTPVDDERRAEAVREAVVGPRVDRIEPQQPPPMRPTGAVMPVGPAKVPGLALDRTGDRPVEDRLAAQELMDEANRAYDRQEYDDAVKISQKLLAAEPGNIRLLRIVVSSACQMGDFDTADGAFQQLPPFDQQQMNKRCMEKAGMAFKTAASKAGPGSEAIRPPTRPAGK